MKLDFGPLAEHASHLEGERPERLAEVRERIGVARRQRRRVALGGAAAAAAVVVGIAVASGVGGPRGAEPANESGGAPARPLVYAVGETIHYGDDTIDVGEDVQFLAVTDDGVAFIREPRRSEPGDKPLWFTDGSGIRRIGTAHGSPARGYAVETSPTGSVLVARTDSGFSRASHVVVDTSTGYSIHRFSAEYGGVDTVVLSVLDDAVYWVAPPDAPCGLRSGAECLRYRWVVRYDVAAETTRRSTWAAYDKDVRSRPRTVVGPDRGTPPHPGTFVMDDPVFTRVGTDLVVRDHDGARDLALSEARTGEPIRLRVPDGTTGATWFEVAQWLDDDRLVLFAYAGRDGGTEWADEGDIFVCALSSGECRLELRGEPGTAYQLPGLD